jgi:DNA-binding MarR family transcriptional regulator
MNTAVENSFGFLVHDVARLIGKRFDERAKSLGVSRTQYRAIAYLRRHEGINQVRLADLLEVQPISMARLLDRMEAGGLIERRLDPGDRRVWRLYLGERAKPLLEKMEACAVVTRAEALAGVSDQHRDLVMTVLRQVHGNLCPACATPAASPARADS